MTVALHGNHMYPGAHRSKRGFQPFSFSAALQLHFEKPERRVEG
jgi:hypothetical protein